LLTWTAWGEACLPKLLGDFSFGFVGCRGEILCCRGDFGGADRWFYARTPGAFCFTNTLQALQCMPGISHELFLAEGMSRDPERSVWRNIRRLPAGHFLREWNGSFELPEQLLVEDPLLFKDPNEYLADGPPRTRLRSARRAAGLSHDIRQKGRPGPQPARAGHVCLHGNLNVGAFGEKVFVVFFALWEFD